jgi:hypothetical protein
MTNRKNLVSRDEIDRCLSQLSNENNKKSAQEKLLKLLEEIEITLDEPIIEDSIDGTRIRVTYTTTISRKRGRINQDVIAFQYIKETPVDYGKVPVRVRDSFTTAASAFEETISHSNNNPAEEDTVIESYDELEKSIPTLYEVLGLLKKIYFVPEDFSNRLVVDRAHKLRNMFSKDEIHTFPSIELSAKAGLIPI